MNYKEPPPSSARLHQQHTKQYEAQQIMTASKEQLLVMLYDGAIRFCKIAKKGIHEKDYEKSNTHLLKAQNIIAEFMASLDLKIGGAVAENLMTLYEYLHHELIQANIQKDTARIDDVLGHLVELRQTWVKAIELVQQEAKAQANIP
jgi:flagellar protein FliS